MKPSGSFSALPRATRWVILRVVLLYALFAAGWIMLSDALLAWRYPGQEASQLAATLKGLAFVAVTSLLLFGALARLLARHAPPPAKVGAGGTASPSGRRGLILAIAVFSALFLAFGGSGVLRDWQRHRASAAEELQSIGRLKLAQIASWLEERRRDAEVVRTSLLLRDGVAQWRINRDPALRERLLARLKSFADALHYQAVAVCDENGEVLLEAGSLRHGSSPTLRETVRRALANDRIQMTDLYRIDDPPPAHVHLDFILPLSSRTAVVLRADVAATLYDILQSWPVPSETAEVSLIRKEGDEVLFLNELRHRADTALKLRLPLSAKEELTVRLLEADYRPGEVIEAIDYRGVSVLGLGLPVPGADWYLVVKIDCDEIFQAAYRGVQWIVLASLMTWLVAVAFSVLAFQRRELQQAERLRAEQEEKLRALQLLEAIANSSSDIIFAKDLAGHFILFNPAAEQMTGKTAAEVLGRGETALFSSEVAERLEADHRRVMEEGAILKVEERLPMRDGERILLTTKGPLRDAAGQTIGMFGIARDITARAANEAALRQSLEELERFNRAMIGRELDMIELKRRINALSVELGREPPYDLTNIDALQGGREGA